VSARKKSAEPAPPPKLTKRQLSRHQRELRRQRYAYIFIGVALALAVLVPAFGYWREVLSRGFEPVATVAGETITADTYARYLALQEAILQRQMQQLASGSQGGSAQLAQLQLQFLQQRLQQLPDYALGEMIDGKLIRDEAKRRGLTATQQELDQQLQAAMSPNPFLVSLGGQSSPAQLSVDDARKQLQTILGKGRYLTEDEYRTYVLETNVYRAKLQEEIGKSVPTAGPQAHARHILVETEDEAKAAKARLDKGEDFAEVAKELSTDTTNKDKGGDLGWFTKGQMVPEFDSAAFSLPVGAISDPIQTSYGYHIIQVLERDEKRPYDDSQLNQLKAKAFDDWLQAQRAPEVNLVEETMTPERYAWVVNTAEREAAKALK